MDVYYLPHSVDLQWFDCGWAPQVTVCINYTYHPSPWVSEYWRFLPDEVRPKLPTVKHGLRSHTKNARKSRSTGKKFSSLNPHFQDSSSHVSL